MHEDKTWTQGYSSISLIMIFIGFGTYWKSSYYYVHVYIQTLSDMEISLINDNAFWNT